MRTWRSNRAGGRPLRATAAPAAVGQKSHLGDGCHWTVVDGVETGGRSESLQKILYPLTSLDKTLRLTPDDSTARVGIATINGVRSGKG